MKVKHAMLFSSALIVLTGCVDYRWGKPGSSEHDRQLAG